MFLNVIYFLHLKNHYLYDDYEFFSFILTMSIDVFGRKLGGAENNRGPPGVGYKITEDNQYDLENKRLCNMGTAIDPDDAVNLKLLTEELKNIRETVSKLKIRLDEVDSSIDIHREELDMKFIEVNADIDKLKNK